VAVAPASGFNATELLTLAAAAESASEHPLARAYQPESAMALGLNIAMYAATH
jgi:cation transport ATPase